MEVLFELPPVNRVFVEKTVNVSQNVFDGYFIPCAPSGTPMLDCLTVGVYILSKLSYPTSIYCSLRTRDHSLNHILERALTASEMGLAGLLITRGDPPLHVDYCREGYSTEEVVDFIRRNGVRIKLGVVSSLRYPFEKVVERAKGISPDFTVAIRFSRGDARRLIDFKNSMKSVKLYVYVLLGVGRNIELFDQLRQPYLGLDELKEAFNELRTTVDGVIVSSPREVRLATEVFSKIL